MLQNAYLDAKIGVDPAENEPSEVAILRSDSGVSMLRAAQRELHFRADIELERGASPDGKRGESYARFLEGEFLSNFCQFFVKFQQNLHRFLHPR